MSERPRWCFNVDCPFYKYDYCRLKQHLIKNWPTLKNREYDYYNKVSVKNSSKVINDCDELK